MTTHELKTWPEPFAQVASGEKVYEIRKDDRGYEVGDLLQLKEFDPADGTFSGHEIIALVKHITRGPAWGLPDGLAILGIRVRWVLKPGEMDQECMCEDCDSRATRSRQ